MRPFPGHRFVLRILHQSEPDSDVSCQESRARQGEQRSFSCTSPVEGSLEVSFFEQEPSVSPGNQEELAKRSASWEKGVVYRPILPPWPPPMGAQVPSCRPGGR